MTITTTTLTRAAALCAVSGGLLFIAVQIKHPHLENASAAATATWTTTSAVSSATSRSPDRKDQQHERVTPR